MKNSWIITLVGCPAVGKTYLADKLSEYFNTSIIYEKPEEGFPKYITDSLSAQTNLFNVINWFRNHQINNYSKALKLRSEGKRVVLDTPYYNSQLYVELYIKDEEKRKVLYDLGRMDRILFQHPDLTIFINTTSEDMSTFLQKRSGERVWEDEKWHDFIIRMAPLAANYINSIKAEIPNFYEINRKDWDFRKETDFSTLTESIELLLEN